MRRVPIIPYVRTRRRGSLSLSAVSDSALVSVSLKSHPTNSTVPLAPLSLGFSGGGKGTLSVEVRYAVREVLGVEAEGTELDMNSEIETSGTRKELETSGLSSWRVEDTTEARVVSGVVGVEGGMKKFEEGTRGSSPV